MEDKFICEDIDRQAGWRICGTTGMDTAAEDMQDGNRRYAGRRRWRNALEEWQWTGQILTGNDYEPEGVLSLL